MKKKLQVINYDELIYKQIKEDHKNRRPYFPVG